MSITTYAELKAKIDTFLHAGGDMDSEIPDFIALCEADMQPRIKLLEFEATTDIAVTAGSGTLPSGFLGMDSLYWNASDETSLRFVAKDTYDAMLNNTGTTPKFYTITGSTFLVSPSATGTATATYKARFAALSDSATTNAVLTNWPNAYLYGSLLHAAIYAEDDAAVQKYGLLFNSYIDRIVRNDEERRFAGPLSIRAR